MKAELLALKHKLDRMFANEAPKHLVVEARNAELEKIIKARQDTLTTSIQNLEKTRAELIDTYAYHARDDPESHARRMRLNDEYAAMPSRELAAMSVVGLDYEAQYARASSLRRRGLHGEADQAHAAIKLQQEAWRGNEIIQSIEKEATKLSMLLPSEDTDHLWVGTDPGTIRQDDFSTVDKATCKIQFKDNDGEWVEV